MLNRREVLKTLSLSPLILSGMKLNESKISKPPEMGRSPKELHECIDGLEKHPYKVFNFYELGKKETCLEFVKDMLPPPHECIPIYVDFPQDKFYAEYESDYIRMKPEFTFLPEMAMNYFLTRFPDKNLINPRIKQDRNEIGYRNMNPRQRIFVDLNEYRLHGCKHNLSVSKDNFWFVYKENKYTIYCLDFFDVVRC